MSSFTKTVGGDGETVEIDIQDDDTCAQLTATAHGRKAAILAGSPSLGQISSLCAAIAAGHTMGSSVTVFAGMADHGTAPDGDLTALLIDGAVSVIVTPRDGEPVAAGLTVAEVAELGQACAAAAHNR